MNIKDFRYLWGSGKVRFVKVEDRSDIPTVEIWQVRDTGEKFRITYRVVVRVVEIKEITEEER